MEPLPSTGHDEQQPTRTGLSAMGRPSHGQLRARMHQMPPPCRYDTAKELEVGSQRRPRTGDSPDR